jgi:drug/metabolite transporter (DMT)-like permease
VIQSSNIQGIGCVLLATAAFVANDTCMKLAMSDAPPLQVLVMRGVSASLWCLPILIYFGHRSDLAKAFNRWVALRSLSEVLAIWAFIFALANMPIADVTAIVQITPFLVMIGSALIWGDRIGPLRWALIAVGITGAMLVAQPGSSLASPFAVLGFVTAVGAAARDLFTRKVDPGIPALVVTFSTILFVMLSAIAGMAVFVEPVPLTGRHIGLMAIAGFFLMCGHLFIFLAFRLAPARVVAPFFYCFLVWAVMSGLLVFGDAPNALAVAGMAVIVVAGLAIMLMEGRTRQGERASQKPDSQVISN